MNLIQFYALLNRFRIISSDNEEEEIEEGHEPIDSQKLQYMSPKQLQKELQKQIENK